MPTLGKGSVGQGWRSGWPLGTGHEEVRPRLHGRDWWWLHARGAGAERRGDTLPGTGSMSLEGDRVRGRRQGCRVGLWLRGTFCVPRYKG